MHRIVSLILAFITCATFLANNRGLAADQGSPLTEGQHGSAAKRVALIIGNGAYRHASRVPHAHEDAQLLGEALKKLNFIIFDACATSRTELRETVNQFKNELRNGGTAFVYYSGHGLSVKGRDYLAPIDAMLTSRDSIDKELLPLEEIYAVANEKTKLLMALQTPGANSLVNNLAWAMGSQVEVKPGLNSIKPRPDTFITVLSGSETWDGERNANSVFASALAEQLFTASDVHNKLLSVQYKVAKQTSGRQMPLVYAGFSDPLYLGSRDDPRNVAEPYPSIVIRNGFASFNIPEALRATRSAQITLTLDADHSASLAALSKAFGGTIDGKRTTESVGVLPRMIAKLHAKDFEVRAAGPEEKLLSEGVAAEWTWYVNPKDYGPNKLLRLELFGVQGGLPPVRVGAVEGHINVTASVWEKTLFRAREAESVAVVVSSFGIIATLWAIFWKVRQGLRRLRIRLGRWAKRILRIPERPTCAASRRASSDWLGHSA